MQTRTTKRYLLKDIFPYPFHPCMAMIPFPRHCEFPKYDKYNGKSDSIDHVRDFKTMSLEFSQEDTYLMRLFPRSFRAHCMEWFSKLQPGIRSFEKLVNKFISQFSFNIQHDVTLKDMYNLK